jgi:hypothetical protein
MPQRDRRARCIVLGAVICIGIGADAAVADLFTRKIPGADVAAAVQRALGATTIHLHSLGALSGGSYHTANASSIKVPAAVTGTPGQRTMFSLPDETRTVLRRRYGYYVNHARSSGMTVAANADSFTISLKLEADGPALVGTCVQLGTSPAQTVRPCTFGGDGVLPGIAWLDGRIDIVAKPVLLGRSLSLDVQNVVIGGTFDVGQTCTWPLVGVRLCATVNRQSQRLREQVAIRVKETLNTADVRQVVAASVRHYLDSLNEPLIGIRRVSMQDGQLTISLGLGR